MRNVTLVLEDGTKFHGKSFGYEAPVAGEVVFNTAMMGYPESLTDPSYAGQLMTLTYPLVGNYGVPPFSIEENGLPTFMESDKIYASAIIVADYSEEYSHWNAVESLAEWLKREHVPGIHMSTFIYYFIQNNTTFFRTDLHNGDRRHLSVNRHIIVELCLLYISYAQAFSVHLQCGREIAQAQPYEDCYHNSSSCYPYPILAGHEIFFLFYFYIHNLSEE